MATTGIYTGYYVWNAIIDGAAVWWADEPLIVAAYNTANDGTVPAWPDGPFVPNGWDRINIWQYSSRCQDVYGWTGNGLDGDIVGPYPPDTPTPPPTGQMIDILPYFQPVGQYGRYVVFHFSDGSTQPQQMEKLGDGRTILWKGEGQTIDGKQVYDYEEILVDSEGVKKGMDTSSGGNSAYDLNWVVWLPRMVEVGKVYMSRPTVRTFNRVTCETTGEADTVDYIYVKELLPTWTSPVNAAIAFNDVLVCEWRKTPLTNTPPIEVYKLAKDVLYCEWNHGYVGELPEGRQPLSFQLTDCE